MAQTAITRVLMEDQKHGVPVGADWAEDPAAFADAAAPARRVLRRARAGRSTCRSTPPAPPFQLAVWEQLRTIPLGTTTTYGDIAARVGRPAASRAVGAAIGRNPIAIVVPCHRVVGASGALTGYAGGLERKTALLTLEGALPA